MRNGRTTEQVAGVGSANAMAEAVPASGNRAVGPALQPPVEPKTAEPANTLTAILLILAAMTLVPMMDGIAKYLSSSYPVTQIVWARYFFHLLALLPIVWWRYGRRALVPRRPVLQVIRGGLLLGSTVLFFAAIAQMPLADALALVFVSPLVVTALSPLLLGETVGMRRWSGVVVGFLGACLIIRPGLEVMQWGSLLALGAGTVYALYIIATRKLSGSAPPLVTLTYTALLGAVVMSVLTPGAWITPGLKDLALMIGMGLLAAAGHFLLIKAFERAPASLLAPFSYSEIVMATIIGYVVFGDFPDPWTWVGIAVIVASGLYISLRERKVKLG